MSSVRPVLTFLLLFTLSTCGGCEPVDNVDWALITDSEEAIADKTIDVIMSAMADKDEDLLLSLFSEKALDEADDLEAGVAYLFSLIPDGVSSWEMRSIVSGDEFEYGKVRSHIVAWYDVYSISGVQYLFFFILYDRDTLTPEGQGVYSIRAVDEAHHKGNWDPWQMMEIPGLYIPDITNLTY
jgi:hypothetical protein